ncbi:B-cell receptor CD22-like [Paroedura picta]|uniref:B-cell receptor CD22-like n=1 Tax=Paroedura picta TaxID=143630 RepID=UPI0040561D3A
MKNLVWLLFLPGFLCNLNPLTINPDSLVTWEGSCVVIPCQINQYMGALLRDIRLLWYYQPFYDTNQSDYSGRLLYNSSVASRKQSSSNRLMFLGNLKNEKKDCSLKISQVQMEDNGTYGARIFASYSHPVQQNKWFLNATINVAESPPYPKIDLNPKDIREGWMRVTCSVTYHCPAEPLKLTISFLGSTRSLAEKTTMSNGMLQTVADLQMTWEDHGKRLVCSLKRQRTEISKSTVELNVKYAPKDVQLISSPGTAIREGETLSMECTCSRSNPEVSEYFWYKDDQLMEEWAKNKNIEFQTERDQHSGAYRCEAKNSVGSEKSKEIHIDVQYPPKEVEVQRKPMQFIKEGEKVELKCSAKGNPWIFSYTWYKLTQAGVFRKSFQLQFNAIQVEDIGTYYCTAENKLGKSDSPPVTLDVLYAPKDVHLAIENDHRPIKEKDTVRLNCSFSHSNPRNHIWYIWHKDKSTLSNQERLLVFTAELEHAGNFTCQVCNTIKCVSSQPVSVDIHYAPKEVKVVQETKNPIHEGNYVILRCEATKANPKVDSYRWYKNGEPHPDSVADQLSIYHLTSADSGTYWCEATNSVAISRSQKLTLDVYYRPCNVSLSLERQAVVTEGTDVSLLCAADANPPPYNFELYRGEEKLKEGNGRFLTLQKVQVEDSGEYHCKAYNTISVGKSQPLMLSVSHSKATKLKHGMIGVGTILSFIFMLGLLIFVLKAWKKKRGSGVSRTEHSGSFFVRKPKPEQLCNNQVPEGAVNSLASLDEGSEEAVSYAMLRFPPSVSEEQVVYARVKAPKVALDPTSEEVVYSMVKKSGVSSMGDTKNDYENVVAQKEEEVHYSSLVNLAPRPCPTYRDSETDSESEESIQYASLKH